MTSVCSSPISPFGRWLGLVLCFEITLGTKYDTWGAYPAKAKWLWWTVVKTYTELVSIWQPVPRCENRTSQRKIRRLSFPSPRRFFAITFYCTTALLSWILPFRAGANMDALGVKFPLHSRHLTKRKRWLVVRLCFVCTEVAVYDHDGLAAILGLKPQWQEQFL